MRFMKKQPLIITSPLFLSHKTGLGHPERPERVAVIYEALRKEDRTFCAPRKALREELLLCHTDDYVGLVEKEVNALQNSLAMLSTGDVVISKDSYEVALYAVGAVLTAVDAVMSGQAKNAFCIVRPPGHHAESKRGMGFCLFNNVAIGARYVQKKYGIKRVLIVDFDVHHGNGTQEIFYEDPSVFYFSTHEAGIYPGTGFADERGVGAGYGANKNVLIRADAHARKKVLEAFEKDLASCMEAFQPEWVFISAGFDAHKEDPIGGLNLEDQDFYVLTQVICQLAKKYAQDRVVSVLEGGYNLEAIARAAVAHVKALGEDS